jgi:protein TonB
MWTPLLQQRFPRLLLLSLAVHAGLFALINSQRTPRPSTLPPLFASLRVVSAPPTGLTVATAQPAATVIPQQVRPLPRREAHVLSHASATAEPTTRQSNPPKPASDATSAPNAPTNSPASAATTETPASSQKPASGSETAARSNADLLAGYRQQLSTLLARQQTYPRIAALRGWEGEVRLRLRVARKGNLLGVVLDHTSGFSVLDEHALAMLASLGNLPPLPEALDSNEIQVVVPINYKLNKTT